MKRNHPYYLIVLSLIFCHVTVAQNCSDILQVAFNTTERYENLDATNSVYNFLQSDHLKEYINRQSGGFELGFKGLVWEQSHQINIIKRLETT